MTLHLLPNLLHPDSEPDLNFIRGLPEIVNSLDGFLVENPKEARKFLKHFDFASLRDKPMEILNKKTEDFDRILQPLENGESWGVITDSGLPCIADPGSKLVAVANKKKIAVKAYPGPCSVILALMRSGLNSQQFIFQGYLPRKIDISIRRFPMTQVFIETPYKNQKSLEDLLQSLHDQDRLVVACDLTLPTEEVISLSVEEWKRCYKQYNFHKRPAIFLIKVA